MDRSLPRVVERMARRQPAAPAVSAAGETLSYGRLNQRANQVAAVLQARGVLPGDLVGLALPRRTDLIAGLLGILKAGAAYVPLDPDYPAARLQRIVDGARLQHLVSLGAVASSPSLTVPTLCLDRDAARLAAADAQDPGLVLAAHDLCYVIFTSGSTGRPKGVRVTHGNVWRLFDHLGPQLGLGADDVWSQLHSCGFGFSVFEIWGALTHGAQLVLAPAAARADGALLRSFLREERISILSQTPSAFRATLLGPAFDAAWEELALRLVVLSGEAVRPDDLRGWSQKRGAAPPRLVNTYAITETGGNLMLREYGEGDFDARNIGHPLPDVRLQILDADGRELPQGEAGELCISGPAVAAGYLDDEALTASRFRLSGGSERRYHSGDLMRMKADGSFEFLGRVDEQLKWHGFRLEPGEIETLLRAHPGVGAAAIAIRRDTTGRERLVAYVMPTGQAAAPQPVEIWPSLGGYQIYDDFLYDLMGSDARRNTAFRQAFERHADGRVVLDLGTGPQALLARMAAEAGARHVYAVELLPEMAARARAAVAAAGLDERITVISGDAAGLELAEPVELCTQGIIGNIGSADGIAGIWNRVRRLFAKQATAIPASCTTWIAPVELPAALREAPKLAPLAREYAERIFAVEGRRFDLRLCLRGLSPRQLLAPPLLFEELDFSGALPETHAGSGSFRLERDGCFDGFLLWTRVTTTPGIDIDYLEHQHAWLPVFLPLPMDGGRLAAGTQIEASWHWKPGSDGLYPDYTVDAVVNDAHDRERYSCHSPHHGGVEGATALHRRLLASLAASPADTGPAALRAWLAPHLPEQLLPGAWVYLQALPLSVNGKLDRQALPVPGPGRWGGQGGAPQSALEEALATIWEDVLGVAGIGREDDFFDLGGDSIAAVGLTVRLQQLLDDDVMLAALFEASSIAALAAHLVRQHAAAVKRFSAGKSRGAGDGGQGAVQADGRRRGEL